MIIDGETDTQPGGDDVAPTPAHDQQVFGNDSQPLGPIDIDLTPDGNEPQVVVEDDKTKAQAEPEPGAQQQQQPRQRPTAANRIGQMRAQLGDAERAIAALQAENEELRRNTQGLAQRNVEADNAAFDQHVARWTAAADMAEREHAAALEKGDHAAIALATRHMAQAESELQAIRAFWANNPQSFNPDGTRKPPQAQVPNNVQPQQQPRPQQQAQPQIQMPEDMATWVQNNPWINADGEDFDQEMAEFATRSTDILDARFKRSGRTAEIGTKAYFDELDKMLASEFPEAYQAAPPPPKQQRKPQMTRPNGAGVAPAQRQQTASPAPGQPGNNQFRMTAEQHDFAMKMINNGAYTYPKGHPNQFQRMNVKDGLRHHAEAILGDRALQKSLGRSE